MPTTDHDETETATTEPHWFDDFATEAAQLVDAIVEPFHAWSARLAREGQVLGNPGQAGDHGDPTFLPDELTPCSPAELYAALSAAAPELPRASLEVLLAQWSLETGGGRSMHCYNIGNAKHVANDGHLWTAFRCNEVLAGKAQWFDPPNPQTWFRAFPSLAAGAADYLALFHHRFTAAWTAVLAGDVAEFGHALKAQHYYTANEAAYTGLLKRLYVSLEKQIPETAEAA